MVASSMIGFNEPFVNNAPSRSQPSRGGNNKKYQCPCGSTMSRSDVLLRHIRKCDQARKTLERSGSALQKATRGKTACNECAASKQKCDSQTPCSRCQTKGLRCGYTRGGYSDPYEIFCIPSKTPNTDSSVKERPQQPNPADSGSPSSIFPTPPGNSTTQPDVLEFGGFDFNMPFEYMNAPLLSGFDTNRMSDDFQDFDWDSLLAIPGLPENVASTTSSAATGSSPAETSSAALKKAPWDFTAGFNLQQVDSVEAKCVEIRGLLTSVDTGIDHASISKYTTRDRLVECIQLYAKYYQSIQPILHLPTFDLIKTPPDLLAAMMLVGACYSTTLIPPTIVVQGAIHFLLVLQFASHEATMSAPPLASIQANALLCQILILARNPRAYQLAAVHSARTISMAERAGLFFASDEDEIRPWELDQNTFDWRRWSESEMRKRLAHHIFVDDIGSNIFTRSASHMSPFALSINTPCYNDCWVAPTASDCLDKLRTSPAPVQVATAIRKLRSASYLQEPHIFNASDCGMLEIVVALHGILFRAMEESLDDEDNVPLDHDPASTQVIGMTLSDLLTRDLLEYDMASIANRLVENYGSVAIRRVNTALDAWLRNWNARRVRDMYDEQHVAFTHPLNFWLLAKLFIILHFFRNRYHGDCLFVGDNDQGYKSELHAFYSLENRTAQARLTTQVTIIGWMSKIRRQQDAGLLSAGSFLSEVLNVQ